MKQDFTGRQIREGHILALPVARGSSPPRLVKRVVVELKDAYVTVRPFNREGPLNDGRSLGRIRYPERTVIIGQVEP